MRAPSILLALAAATLAPAARASPDDERFDRVGSNPKSWAVLTVHERREGEVVLSMEVVAKPSATAAFGRNGRLSRERLELVDGVAIFREAEVGMGGCSIRFRFGQPSVEVRQSNACALFGVGIDASGTYAPDSRHARPPPRP